MGKRPLQFKKDRRRHPMYHIRRTDLVAYVRKKTPIRARIVHSETKPGWWEIEITVENSPTAALLVGTSGEPRRWRELTRAVNYIDRAVPYLDEILIKKRTKTAPLPKRRNND